MDINILFQNLQSKQWFENKIIIKFNTPEEEITKKNSNLDYFI